MQNDNTRDHLQAIFLEWMNDFLTIEGFASHYGLTIEEAAAVVDLSRKVHKERTGGAGMTPYQTDTVARLRALNWHITDQWADSEDRPCFGLINDTGTRSAIVYPDRYTTHPALC